MRGETLDKQNWLESLHRLNGRYGRTAFNENAKFGFLRMAVTKIAPLATFAMYQGARNYEQLTRAVREFVSEVKAFCVDLIESETRELKRGWSETNVKVLVRSDAGVQSMKA